MAKKAKSGNPVPSSAMYIGLCQTRATAAILRWQYAIVFMALNGVAGGWCFQQLDPEKWFKMILVVFITLLMLLANLLFRGLVDRANQWIDYYTVAAENIELKFGTESGIFVFADQKYLAKQAAEPLVKGWRFRSGIRILSISMVGVWGLVFLISLVWASVLIGQGKWL